jgi:hypothetical protein
VPFPVPLLEKELHHFMSLLMTGQYNQKLVINAEQTILGDIFG